MSDLTPNDEVNIRIAAYEYASRTFEGHEPEFVVGKASIIEGYLRDGTVPNS